MIGIFQGRGIADSARVHAQIDVDFREHIYLFNNGRNLNALGVFLCIALHANEGGWAWPGRDLIKRETGIGTEAALTSALAHLRTVQIAGHRVFAHYREDREDKQHGRSAYLIFPDIPSGKPPGQFENLKEYDPHNERQPLTDNPLTDDPLADDPLADDPLADDPLADDPSHEAEPVSEAEPNKDIGATAPSHLSSEQEPVTLSEQDELDGDDAQSQAEFEILFGPTPPPAPTPPRTADDLVGELRQTEARMFARAAGEPWRVWGEQSGVIRRYGQEDVPKDVVQRIGLALQEVGLVPDWSDAREMKTWLHGIQKLYRTAGCDVQVVIDAVNGAVQTNAQRARDQRLSLVKPHSFLFAVRDAVAAQRQAPLERSPLSRARRVYT